MQPHHVLRVPQATANFPPETFSSRSRKTALCDLLTRTFHAVAAGQGMDQHTGGGGWHGAKGGELLIDCPGQHVLERSSVLVSKLLRSLPDPYQMPMQLRAGALAHLVQP